MRLLNKRENWQISEPDSTFYKLVITNFYYFKRINRQGLKG